MFGGCGFIGSYLVEELGRRNYDVLAADIVLSDFVDRSRFVFCDILDRESVRKVVQGADFVYNLAGVVDINEAIADPLRTMQLNVIGNLNILEASRESRVKRFVYSSSAYAMNEKGSFYGISKLACEKIIEEYYKRFGLKFTILRYGSVYGEREFKNNYIYNLVKEAILTGKIVHETDGEEIRDYIHVRDVAKLSVDIIESEQYENEHIILTGVERIKRKELFEMINEILGGKLKIIFQGKQPEMRYKITPYSIYPSSCKKLIPNLYIDMGQGILDCIKDIEEKYA